MMLWLVPFDGLQLPISLPLDATFDRPVLVVVATLWLVTLLAVRDKARPRLRWSGVHTAILLFVITAVLSLLLNAHTLGNLGEFELGLKKLALLASYCLLFTIVASSVRPSEVKAFTGLIVLLACITALGTIWEYRTGFNVFYTWTDKLLPGDVALPVTAFEADATGRTTIFGPTAHPLALAALLSLAVPFTIVRLMEARTAAARWMYAGALLLILAGDFSTQRKTTVLALAAALLVLALYRPRRMLRFAPLGAVLLVGVSAVSPSALGSVRDQIEPGRADAVLSTRDRESDYDAVTPDVKRHPLIGRGYQTYEPEKYRVLDNEYLAILIGNGAFGVIAYVLLFIAIFAVCHRIIRSRDPVRGPPALAVASGVALLLVTSALFDVIAFPHVPYMLFFMAGLAVACSVPREEEVWHSLT
jgi:hypothetical protein